MYLNLENRTYLQITAIPRKSENIVESVSTVYEHTFPDVD